MKRRKRKRKTKEGIREEKIKRWEMEEDKNKGAKEKGEERKKGQNARMRRQQE